MPSDLVKTGTMTLDIKRVHRYALTHPMKDKLKLACVILIRKGGFVLNTKILNTLSADKPIYI